MIKCHQCNAENMLGAIFCRNCGTRLEIDKFRPETVDQRRRRQGRSWGGRLYRLTVFALLLLLAAGLAGIFLPSPKRPVPALGAAELAAAEARFDSFALPRRAEAALTFTSAEATALANKRLLTDAGAGGPFTVTAVTLDFRTGGHVLVTVAGKLLGKLPMENQALVRLESGAGTPAKVTVVKVRAGKLPIPAFAHSLVLQRIEPLFAGNAAAAAVRENVRAIEVEDGEAKVVLLSLRERLQRQRPGGN
ncbi:MAG: zinc ribbon domain-containing protein [Lentisphaeria bacterium]|jgi:hypothetical protein